MAFNKETRLSTLAFLQRPLLFLFILLPQSACRYKGELPKSRKKQKKEIFPWANEPGSQLRKQVWACLSSQKHSGRLDLVGTCRLSWQAHWRLAKLSIQPELMLFGWKPFLTFTDMFEIFASSYSAPVPSPPVSWHMWRSGSCTNSCATGVPVWF